MNGVYYIKNTVDDFQFHETIKGYFSTLDDAKKALKKCGNWSRPYGTGRIYWVDFGLNKKPMLIYEKR